MLSPENNQTLTFFNGLLYLPIHLVRLGTNYSSYGDELQFLRQRTTVPTATNCSSKSNEPQFVQRRTLKGSQTNA